jgi:hypothetical protein
VNVVLPPLQGFARHDAFEHPGLRPGLSHPALAGLSQRVAVLGGEGLAYFDFKSNRAPDPDRLVGETIEPSSVAVL